MPVGFLNQCYVYLKCLFRRFEWHACKLALRYVHYHYDRLYYLAVLLFVCSISYRYFYKVSPCDILVPPKRFSSENC